MSETPTTADDFTGQAPGALIETPAVTEPATGSATGVESEAEPRPRAMDVLNGSNHWDRLAIKRFFGARVTDMSGDETMVALAFLLLRREGQSDENAFAAATSESLAQTAARFAQDDEADDEADDGEPGKALPQ